MNNKYSVNNHSISIRKILWRIAEQWKAIVCFALIVMVLFLGYRGWSCASKLKTITNEHDIHTGDPSGIISELPKEEQKAVTSAYELRRQLLSTEEYIQNSPLMIMNPYQAKRFKTDWTIIDESGRDAVLSEAYIMHLESDEFCQQLVSCFRNSAEIEQVREAIDYDLIGEETHGSFSCVFYLFEGVDEAKVKKAIPLAMKDAQKRISTEIGNHQIKCISKETINSEDRKLEEFQNIVYERASFINAQLKAKTEGLSQEQKAIYEKLLSLEEHIDQDSQPVKNKISLRDALIGLMLGVVIYIACWLLYSLVIGRVFSNKDLEDSGLYTLGQWYQDKTLKGVASLFVDKSIVRCQHKMSLDKDRVVHQTEKAILNACKEDKKQLLFTFIAPPSTEQQSFCEEIREGLLQSGISAELFIVNTGESLFNEISAVDVDGVILVAIEGKTRFKHIDKIVTQCDYYDVPVLGQIYLG